MTERTRNYILGAFLGVAVVALVFVAMVVLLPSKGKPAQTRPTPVVIPTQAPTPLPLITPTPTPGPAGDLP
jgi:hypothetical protein